jgi:NAD(P)-dependent dehydrogenase (short-subunit alcohol dehydrogenase family)
MTTFSSTPAIVVGAGRGLGLGIATALAATGTQVIAISRTASTAGPAASAEPSTAPRPASVTPAGIRTELADAAEPSTAARLLDRHNPGTVIVVAGASPALLPLQEQTWESFSINWNADVKIAFHWLQAALHQPLSPGSRVIVFSSGAALAGSPLSGGYAGAKATQRFMTAYAQDESTRAGLDISFTAILPRLTPLTDLGRPAARAYAARAGLTDAAYVQQLGSPLTPSGAGDAITELLDTKPADLLPAYLLTGDGLRPLP